MALFYETGQFVSKLFSKQLKTNDKGYKYK